MTVRAVSLYYVMSSSNDLIAGHYQTNIRAVSLNYVMISSVIILKQVTIRPIYELYH